MNHWTSLSIKYANQKSYLDDLFRVYPTIPEGIRDIDEDKWAKVEDAFNVKNNNLLIEELLGLDLFPIKDSYVAYLRRDRSAIRRNPNTVNRICGRIYEIGLTKLFEKCSEPKETNRQIGPMFRNWIRTMPLGIQPVKQEQFMNDDNNAILDAADDEMRLFAREHLGFTRNKGLDFIARFNKKYVVGEAKFLTDFGGHQNAQFQDAIQTLESTVIDNVMKIAILDGVLYIKSDSKMYKSLLNEYKEHNIMSALILREFLYSI